jgi:transposase-like protein
MTFGILMFYGRIFSLFLVTVVYSLFVSVMAGRPSARTFIVPVGIERATGRLFAQTVLNRNANTLIPLIQQHIAWGSHIISDGWAAYDSIPSDVYTHSVVIHADNFVAPHDACIHTQNIESAWSRMKHKLKCHRGTSQALFDSYIAEHVWRSYRDCDCKFSYLIAEIIRQYPF